MIVLFWLENSSASEMYKDAIVYQQGKLMMQPGKYLPKVVSIKYAENAEFKKLITKYKLKAYPTLVLMDENAQQVRTIIGFSWFETPILYMTQKQMTEGKGFNNLSLVSFILFRNAWHVKKKFSMLEILTMIMRKTTKTNFRIMEVSLSCSSASIALGQLNRLMLRRNCIT
jgi:hypothetical protein